MRTIDFKCTYDNLDEIPEKVVASIGIDFPKIHTKAKYIASLSKN